MKKGVINMKNFILKLKGEYHYFLAGVYSTLSKVKFLNKEVMIEKGREQLEFWKCYSVNY